MALAVIQEQNLTDIADAIRAKNGTSDTYLPSQMAQAITNIPTGGGQDSGGKYLVQVIDYDGTVLKQDHLNSGATFTMPDQPSHSRLVFQEWSSPVTITNGEVTVGNSDITIGAVYTTASRLNEFDIVINKATGKTISFYANSQTVDWGDGTSDTASSHTYADYGEYTIKTSYAYASQTGNIWLVRAFLCTYTILPYQAFYNKSSLKSVTIPVGVTSAQAATFESCRSLGQVIFPSTMTKISGGMFSNCFKLSKVVLPSNAPQIESMAFNYCYSTTGTIRIPATQQNIQSNTFYQCDFSVYDFSDATAVIPLSNANAFNGALRAQTKFIVPDALYDSWIAETNWITLANYIYKASDV